MFSKLLAYRAALGWLLLHMECVQGRSSCPRQFDGSAAPSVLSTVCVVVIKAVCGGCFDSIDVPRSAPCGGFPTHLKKKRKKKKKVKSTNRVLCL